METRLTRELDSMLVESYVNLDCNQLDSSKVVARFKRVYSKKTALTVGREFCSTLSLSSNSTMD